MRGTTGQPHCDLRVPPAPLHSISKYGPCAHPVTMAHLDGDSEWIGEWYLPGTAERVPGLLRYAGGQVRLELLRPLANVEAETVAAVLGHTRRGPVTLSDVIFETPLQASAYSAVFAPQGDAEKVFEATFSFDLLGEWAVPGRPHTDAAKIYDMSDPATFGEDALEQFESQLDDGARCTLSVSLGFSHHAIEGTRQYHDSWFRIASRRGLPLREVVTRYVYPINHFLVAAMGRPLNLSAFHIILDKRRSVEVYLPVKRQPSSGSFADHFFNIGGIKDSFDGTLRRWFDLHKKSPLHLRLFFRTLDTRYSDPLYFYVYATVLEIWNAANSSLAGANYRKRIEQALKLFEDDFENTKEFADKVYAIRNAMVHHIPERELDDDELLRVTHDLFYLIRVMLLEHCGLKVRHGAGGFVFLKKRGDSKRFTEAAGWQS